MSIGQVKETGREVFRLPRVYSSSKGFTLVEILVSALIMAVIVAALFIVLNIGQTTNSVSSAKVDLQAKVRQIVDMIARDVRKTVSWEIADVNNTPGDSHIKFRQVEGWDDNTSTFVLSANYIEYIFDGVADTITRNVVDSEEEVLQTQVFSNITAVPFYTRDSDGDKVALNQGDLLTSRRLIVDIAGEVQLRGSQNLSAALSEEVKIRNE